MPVLTASPFHPQTGALLPVYLQAYLLGDLVTESMDAVTQYLRLHPDETKTAYAQWQQLQAEGEVPAEASAPWELRRSVAAASSPRPRWPRLPSLRLFGLLIGLLVGLGLTGATYGVSLLYQQKQVNKRGPVFKKTEQDLEVSSAFNTKIRTPTQH